MDRARLNFESFRLRARDRRRARRRSGSRRRSAASAARRRRSAAGGLRSRPGRAPVGARDDLPFGVVGRAFLAPAHAEAISLGAVLHDRHGLGRLAESDRQHAGRERIERAGVARLLGVEQELEPPDGLGRGDAGRLVEIDPAVDLDPGRALLRGFSRSRPSRASTPEVRRRGRRRSSLSSSPASLEVPRDRRRSQERVHARLRVEARIQGEAQIGSELEIDAPRDESAQFLLVAVERLDRRSGALAAERHHQNRRQLEVRRHAHGGDGQRMAIERVVAHFAAREDVGDRVADQFADPLEPVARPCGLEKERGIALSFWAQARPRRATGRSMTCRAVRRQATVQIDPS